MPRLEFTLTGDYVELHNLLKLMGLADSGGAAKARVAMAEVKVDARSNCARRARFARARPCSSTVRPSGQEAGRANGVSQAAVTETQDMLDFRGEHGITSDIEMIRMDEINTACERTLASGVKYGFVIDMSSLKQ